jgi:hypothetical protein
MSIGVGDTNTQGTSSGGIQSTPTYLGTDAGQALNPGMISQLLQQYMTNQQGQTGANNNLYGGAGYDPTGQNGSQSPGGGLVGTYQGLQNNPWQTGPNGATEADALGSYNWMSSGDQTAPESQVYGAQGNMAGGPFGAGGVEDPNNPGQTLQGEGSQFNQGLMGGQQSALEQGATSGYQGFANGPNAQEQGLYGATGQAAGPTANQASLYGTTGNLAGPTANQSSLYGTTGAFGSTPGKDLQGAESVYNQETGPNAGYDAATKEAMTRESTSAVRSPFEQARDRMLRGAAARGNVGSTQGAEIQMANNEAGALGDAASKNQIAQAQEAIRQKETGAAGLQGTQGISNAQQEAAIASQAGQNTQLANQALGSANAQAGQNTQLAGQRQAALNSQAGQNAQLAGQKLAGTQGLASMGSAQRGQQALGASNQASLAAAGTAQKQAALNAQNLQNQQQRATQLAGTQGKAGMFNTMAQRQAGATAGLQGLYGTGQQVAAGQQAGAANLGTQKAQDSTVFGNQNNTGTGNWSL